MVRFSRVFGTVAFVLSLIVVSAFAESSSVSAKADPGRIPAECWFFDADGKAWLDTAAELRVRETDNGYSYTCQGQLPEGAVLPTGVMQWDSISQPDYFCVTPDDWKSISWPSGKARWTCHGKF